MGVLHAIDPEDGTELWSYTPEELLPNIKAYVDNKNTTKHIYGLDGQPVLNSTRIQNPDGTLVTDKAWLYLSQRRGGNNIFALDVTNALDDTDPFKVMWKIKGGVAGTDFRDLGQTWSTPQLITVTQGCPANCTNREVLMFSGGYNPAAYDDRQVNFPVGIPDTGHGNAIYMVDPQTGDLLWSAGRGIHHSLELPNLRDSVPETPVPVDYNADGVIDVLFFSDIAGHVWRVDLDASAATGNNLSDLAIVGGMIADLNEQGDPYFVLSSGIAPPLDIVDTGGVGGSTLLAGSEAISLYDLLQPDVPNTFRRFVRTGWIELDD